MDRDAQGVVVAISGGWAGARGALPGLAGLADDQYYESACGVVYNLAGGPSGGQTGDRLGDPFVGPPPDPSIDPAVDPDEGYFPFFVSFMSFVLLLTIVDAALLWWLIRAVSWAR